jgi:mRNA interferase MazF
MRRGDVWWIDWPPGRGSEQGGRRPGLVVQSDAANRSPSYPNAIAVAVSRQGRGIPFHVRLAPTAENGLTTTSFAKCEQVITLSKACFDRRMGTVSDEDMQRVDQALRWVLDL